MQADGGDRSADAAVTDPTPIVTDTDGETATATATGTEGDGAADEATGAQSASASEPPAPPPPTPATLATAAATPATPASHALSVVEQRYLEVTEEVAANLKRLRKQTAAEVLAMFTAVCAPVLQDPVEMKVAVRRIKDLFIKRDFLAIFTDRANLYTYLARWVPPRALCYIDLFGSNKVLRKILSKNVRCTCLGAGPGSELVALSALAALHPSGSAEGGKKRFLDL